MGRSPAAPPSRSSGGWRRRQRPDIRTGNDFRLGGEDLNGIDLAFDGNGSGNCWGPNSGVQVLSPADPAMFPACPFDGANTFSQDAQNALVSRTGANAVNGWVRHPHKARRGVKPLEVYEK